MGAEDLCDDLRTGTLAFQTFSKYLSSTYCVSGTVEGTWDPSTRRQAKFPAPAQFTFWQKAAGNKQYTH